MLNRKNSNSVFVNAEVDLSSREYADLRLSYEAIRTLGVTSDRTLAYWTDIDQFGHEAESYSIMGCEVDVILGNLKLRAVAETSEAGQKTVVYRRFFEQLPDDLDLSRYCFIKRPPQVFISCCHEDKQFVRAPSESLEKRGVTSRRPGAALAKKGFRRSLAVPPS